MSIDPDRFRRPSADPAPPRPSTLRPLTDVSAVPRRTAPPLSKDVPEPEPALPEPRIGRSTPYLESPTVTVPESKPQPSQQRTVPEPATNVTINISMPKFKKPTVPDWPWHKIRKIAFVVGALIIVSLVLRAVIGFAVEQHRQNELKNRIDQVEQRTQPTFKPLTPAGRTASVTKQAAFDAKRDSYSYNDTFKGTGLVVSQQPLGDESAIAKIAKSMNATTPLTIASGTAYVAGDKGSNGQMIVAAKRGMLIFVQSAFTHSAEDWKSYLDNLAT